MSYLYISVFIMRENVLFSEEIFTAGKNFTLPEVVLVGSDKYHLFLLFIHIFGELGAI